MTHPHDPYTIPREYWDLYREQDIPLPEVRLQQHEQDPHSQRLLKVIDLWDKPLPEQKIIDARRAYFGACSYVDTQIGTLLETLADCGLAEDTIVVFSGDHGDMLGERGLWYKMHWFEMAARVPLLVHAPKRFAPGRVKASVSTVDLLPTLVELAGGTLEPQLPLDGRSLLAHLEGRGGHDEVIGEYMAEGTTSPLMMIRRGPWKFIYSEQDPLLLYDLQNDPRELENLAESALHREVVEAFLAQVRARWDIPAIHQATLASQRRRRFVAGALEKGRLTSWDHQPGSTPASSTCATTSTSTIWSAAHVIHSHDQRERTHGRPLQPQGNVMKTITTLFAGALLSSAMTYAQAEDASCATVKLGDPGWSDIAVTNGVARQLLEGLGYRVEIQTLAVPIIFAGLQKGQVDAFLGNWMPAQQSNYDKFVASGEVDELGQNLSGTEYTLAVPAYAYEAGVKTFADLDKHADKFKHTLYGIAAGSPANVSIQEMIKGNEFGLGDWKLVESSEQAMLVQVGRAVKRNDFVVFLGWTPHPMNVQFDIRYLKGGEKYFGESGTVNTLARKATPSSARMPASCWPTCASPRKWRTPSWTRC